METILIVLANLKNRGCITRNYSTRAITIITPNPKKMPHSTLARAMALKIKYKFHSSFVDVEIEEEGEEDGEDDDDEEGRKNKSPRKRIFLS